MRPVARPATVNGQPRDANAEDLSSLDQNGLQQSFQFQDLKNQLLKSRYTPETGMEKPGPNSQTGQNGGLQFVIGYPLRNGCATCAHAGFALFTWELRSHRKVNRDNIHGNYAGAAEVIAAKIPVGFHSRCNRNDPS